MNRRIRKLLRERRREVRARIREQKAKLAVLRREARRRRPASPWRRRILIIILLLLLLLLLRPCEPEGPAVVRPRPPPQIETATVTKAPEEVKKKPIVRRTKKRKRPAYEGEEQKKKSWLDDFRLQVAGRSVRLAGCFEGVERPGAVRWVAAVDPKSGKVSDHSLEPVASSAAINTRQRACLVDVLSDPPYRLVVDEGSATSERVGLVLEF